MKITKIEQQKKRKERYSIFVDGKYSLSLPETELVSTGIKKGQELTAEQHSSLIELSGASKLYDQAINYLSYRARSVKETKDHLTKKGHDPAKVGPVIDKLLKQKLLDDTAFARSWVESRQLLKPSSKRKLVLELRQKGIGAEIIEQILADQDPGDEVQAAKKIAQKKLILPRYQDRRRLTEYLLRQGFSYDAVKAALNEVTSD